MRRTFSKSGSQAAPRSRAGSNCVLSRRIGDSAVIVVLSSSRSALSPNLIAEANRRLDGALPADPRSVAAALDDIGPSNETNAAVMSVLTVGDAARTIRVGALGHSLWVRRGPLLQRLVDDEARYRPGDVIFFADGAPFAGSERVLGLESIPLLTESDSVARIARSFLRAAIAATARDAKPVTSVAAVRILSRSGSLARRRLQTAVVASLSLHLLATVGLQWLPAFRERQQRRVEKDQVLSIVTISSAARRSRRAVTRHAPPPSRVTPTASSDVAARNANQAIATRRAAHAVVPTRRAARTSEKPARTRPPRAVGVVADVGIAAGEHTTRRATQTESHLTCARSPLFIEVQDGQMVERLR
jgi:hypothetical protein